jgi:hypothetical protein
VTTVVRIDEGRARANRARLVNRLYVTYGPNVRDWLQCQTVREEAQKIVDDLTDAQVEQALRRYT